MYNMIFLMMHIRYSKHVEDKKLNYNITLKSYFCWLTLHN